MQMMGNADEIPQAPADRPKFFEDMTSAEVLAIAVYTHAFAYLCELLQRAAAMKLPAGLKNLGNTCYLNSVLQCMKSVPEFAETLAKYPVCA